MRPRALRSGRPRRPVERQRSRARRRLPTGLWLALGGSLGVVLGLLAPGHLASLGGSAGLVVRSVSIAGAERVSAGELVRLAAVEPGTAFDRIDARELARRLTAHPWVASARVTTLAPDRLLLAVEERRPVALARDPGGAAGWLVDAGGTPFARPEPGRAAPPGLPEIRGAGELRPDEPDARLAQALRVLAAARERGIEAVRAVEVGGAEPRELPALVLRLPGGETRVLLGAAPLAETLGRLARLLAGDPPEARGAAVYDVRFGGQVILRSGATPEGAAAGSARGRARAEARTRTGKAGVPHRGGTGRWHARTT